MELSGWREFSIRNNLLEKTSRTKQDKHLVNLSIIHTRLSTLSDAQFLLSSVVPQSFSQIFSTHIVSFSFFLLSF